MSIRMKKIACVVVAIVGVVIWRSTAEAQTGGSDGGDTVTVGVATSSTWPGHLGHPATAPRGGGERAKAQCTDIPLPTAQTDVLGAGGPTPGMWYLVKCPILPGNPTIEHLIWIPTASNAEPPVSTAGGGASAAAAQAESSISLPPPSIRLSPGEFSVVNLPSWLGIDPALWHPFVATATAGGITASATATPESVAWSMGDGGLVTCYGPGSLYNSSLPETLQNPSCSYTYRRSSIGQPSTDGDPNGGAFRVTATVTWTVRWVAIGEPGGGTLPSLHTSSFVPVRVEQVESVGAGL